MSLDVLPASPWRSRRRMDAGENGLRRGWTEIRSTGVSQDPCIRVRRIGGASRDRRVSLLFVDVNTLVFMLRTSAFSRVHGEDIRPFANYSPNVLRNPAAGPPMTLCLGGFDSRMGMRHVPRFRREIAAAAVTAAASATRGGASTAERWLPPVGLLRATFLSFSASRVLPLYFAPLCTHACLALFLHARVNWTSLFIDVFIDFITIVLNILM